MNNSLTQMLMNYAPLIVLFVLGWFFGARHERQHLAQLRVAEQELSHIIVSSERFYVPKIAANTEGGIGCLTIRSLNLVARPIGPRWSIALELGPRVCLVGSLWMRIGRCCLSLAIVIFIVFG